MKWTIKNRVTTLGGAGLAVVLALGLSSYMGSKSINAGIEQMAVASSALRNEMQCDMMHDAIRADVLAFSHPEGEEGMAEARKSLTEHTASMRTALKQNT